MQAKLNNLMGLLLMPLCALFAVGCNYADAQRTFSLGASSGTTGYAEKALTDAAGNEIILPATYIQSSVPFLAKVLNNGGTDIGFGGVNDDGTTIPPHIKANQNSSMLPDEVINAIGDQFNEALNTVSDTYKSTTPGGIAGTVVEGVSGRISGSPAPAATPTAEDIVNMMVERGLVIPAPITEGE